MEAKRLGRSRTRSFLSSSYVSLWLTTANLEVLRLSYGAWHAAAILCIRGCRPRRISECRPMTMDPGEFRRLVEEHQRMVFSIALRVARDRMMAEEIAQDVFLELYRSGERLQGADHTRFWLRRVAVHRATDALRRQKRQPERGAEEWMDEQHGAGPPAPAGLTDGMAYRLESMVGSLPEAMRVAVILRYGEDMTPDEICRLLGQPLPTVKSNLQRGLKMLRQKATVTMKEYLREQRA